MGKVISCKIIYGTQYFKVLFEQKSMADFVRMVGMPMFLSKKNQSMMFFGIFVRSIISQPKSNLI